MKLLRRDGTEIGEGESLRKIVIAKKANLSGADLSWANLSGADLSGADLFGANLSRANLSGADLSGADLSGANLSGADLSRADLFGANLSRADLSGADLSRANLFGANLSRANLSRANLSWNSHALVGEILKRAAENDKALRQVAGLVIVSTDWCWEKLLTELTPEQIAWCKETLRPWWEGKEEQLPEEARKIVEASK